MVLLPLYLIGVFICNPITSQNQLRGGREGEFEEVLNGLQNHFILFLKVCCSMQLQLNPNPAHYPVHWLLLIIVTQKKAGQSQKAPFTTRAQGQNTGISLG